MRGRAEESTRAEDGGESPDGAIVTVVSGAAKGSSVRVPAEIGAVIRIGKSSDNDLVLPDDTVSRHHLTIGRVERGICVRDLDSMNGVKVGGARVKEALLETGAVIVVGGVEMILGVEAQGVEVPPSPHDRFGDALGKSIVMRRIFGLLERIAPTKATVLLLGETGTGKDVLAHAVHRASPRANAPFEVVDCGAVTPTLVESELFGHEKGAFTGAIASRAGAFERANGGTLFLDEIGELPLDLQPKLLRVLEAREFRRVGGNKSIASDVRVVAATTRDLATEVRKGTFREDLYFRLAVVPVHVPPLRKRGEDVAMIAEAILASIAADGGTQPLTLPKETLHALRVYEWPGNVRELRNVLERCAYLTRASGKRELRLVDFPPTGAVSDDEDVFGFDESMSYRQARARVELAFERRYVQWVLARHGGNVSAAARAAQMDRKYLADLAKKHGIGGGGGDA